MDHRALFSLATAALYSNPGVESDGDIDPNTGAVSPYDVAADVAGLWTTNLVLDRAKAHLVWEIAFNMGLKLGGAIAADPMELPDTKQLVKEAKAAIEALEVETRKDRQRVYRDFNIAAVEALDTGFQNIRIVWQLKDWLDAQLARLDIIDDESPDAEDIRLISESVRSIENIPRHLMSRLTGYCDMVLSGKAMIGPNGEIVYRERDEDKPRCAVPV